MQQVKLFMGVESRLEDLEREVNGWLRENGVRVVSIRGNIAPQTPAKANLDNSGMRNFLPSDLFVMVVYEAAE